MLQSYIVYVDHPRKKSSNLCIACAQLEAVLKVLYKSEQTFPITVITLNTQYHGLEDLAIIVYLVHQCLEELPEPFVVHISPEDPNLADAVLWVDVSQGHRCRILDQARNIVFVA
mmetsp:Transcript_27411/g.63854  ORF Transcript_27411/g.63854 Transcript_27411/m.63854 type:complete len:115 (-) Transcript_27411:927-1271(-)